MLVDVGVDGSWLMGEASIISHFPHGPVDSGARAFLRTMKPVD
jgi:hypothetical protein